MQRALVTACVLLALIVALRADRIEALSREHTPPGDAASSTPVVVYSAGQGIQPIELRLRPMHDAIILDGALLSTDPEIPGLRVLRMSRGRRIDAYRNFDMLHNPAAAEALERFARATPPGGLLALSATGAWAPAGHLAERNREILRVLFASLGLDDDPTAVPAPSLCLVALKRRDGWTLLGSAVSNVEPVRLALNVDGALRRPADVEPLTIDARVSVLALTGLPFAASSNVDVDRNGALLRLSRSGLKNVDPERDGRSRARLSWDGVPLGPDATFSCGLQLREPGGGTPSLSGGEVILDLHLDGELIARERLARTQQAFARARAWRVPLRATSANSAGRLELRAAQTLGHPAVEMQVVRPIVTVRGGAGGAQ